MKKLVVLLLAFAMVLGMAAPAMAQAPASVSTGVTISGGSGAEPFIKAKWEEDDDDPATPGTQINPPVSYQGTVPIEFYVVVADNPITDVSVVSVDVYHPAGYPESGSFKFEVILNDHDDALSDGVITGAEATAAIAEFNEAYAAGLVVLNSGITAADVVEEISQGEAWLWCGSYEMYYHQPAGDYLVDAFAIDAGPVAPESHLTNYFTYVAVTACEFDFTAVNYGAVTTDGVVSGDSTFGTGGPTMRNIGNTWLQVQIQQDDMGFGFTLPGPVWNVRFDARIGSTTDAPQGADGSSIWFDPAFAKGPTAPDAAKWTTIPGVVHLCNTWKIDFSIHINKAILPSYTGTMWLRCVPAPFTGVNIPHPGTLPPA